MNKTYEQIRQECLDEIRAIGPELSSTDVFKTSKIMRTYVDKMVERAEIQLGRKNHYVKLGKQFEELVTSVSAPKA